MTTIADNIPAHVPRELVFDFDMYGDKRLEKDLHLGYLQLQKEVPGFFYTPRNGGHWVAIRQKDVQEIGQNLAGKFTSWRTGIPAPNEATPVVRVVPIDMDGDEHRKYRRVLAPLFSPQEVMKMESGVRDMAVELIENIKRKGSSDFVNDVAIPLPVKFFMKIMGMPLDRYEEFVDWVDQFFNTNDTDVRNNTGFMIYMYLDELVKERTANPKDDLISKIVVADVDGVKISDELVMGMCFLLFVAGLDTVTNAMSYVIRYLAENPDHQNELRDSKEKIPEAIEELLRRFAFANTLRMVKLDCEFRGIQLKQGEPVLLCLPMGGLDDKFIENPSVVDFQREKKTHFIFGSGQHRCVGSHLARLELKILLEEILDRLPEFKLVDDVNFRPGIVNAIRNIRIAW